MRTMANPEVRPTSVTASLGDLLVATRAHDGVALDDLGRATGLAVERIAAVESGRHDLTDEELATLLEQYPIPSPCSRFRRAVVEIDLDGGILRVVRRRGRRPVPTADRNLLSYLVLVHRHHDLDVGADMPLKAVDLDLLRASLALRRTDVTSRLHRMSAGFGPRLHRNHSLLAAAAATGLVVSAGAIVLIPPAASESKLPGGTIDPRIEIGAPMVIERDAAAALDTISIATDAEPSVAAEATPAAVPAPRIGRPLVIERPAGEAVPAASDREANGPRGPPQTNE